MKHLGRLSRTQMKPSFFWRKLLKKEVRKIFPNGYFKKIPLGGF